MANTYESKFKGAEVDEGVNIARNLAGTGGIDIRTLGTGINTVKTIDGSTLMTALGEKQDTLTVSSNIHINSLMADHAITLGNFSSGSISLYPQSGASGNAYLPKYGGYLATTGDIPAVVPITGTGTTTVMSQKAVTDELGKKQDKITDQTSLDVGALTVYQGLNAYGGLSVTGADSQFNHDVSFFGNATFNNEAKFDSPSGASFVIGDGSSRRQALLGTTAPRYATGNMAIYLPDRSGTLALLEDIPASPTGSPTGNFMPDTPSGPYAMLVASGGVGNTPTWEDIRDGTIQANFLVYDKSNGRSYHAHTTGAIFEAYNTGSGTLKKFTLIAPTGDATVTVTIPNKSGTLATLDDIPTGGGGSAGVSSIGGKTGAITLSTGLAMSGQQLVNKVKVYTSGNYLCIDTN